MSHSFHVCICITLILFQASFLFSETSLSHEEEGLIAMNIWRNECRQSINGLVSWNSGEDFASCGIGHFIWYPAQRKTSFEETFPRLLRFLQTSGARLPQWLMKFPPCPWTTKEEFYEAKSTEKFAELSDLLVSTIDLQARFLITRLEEEMVRADRVLDAKTRTHIHQQYDRLWKDENGKYVLVDYVNFKGIGLSEKERYQGRGWGLIQVLSCMGQSGSTLCPATEFALCAKKILARRVALSPPEREEGRWLQGWFSRIDTYIVLEDKSAADLSWEKTVSDTSCFADGPSGKDF
jgi:hypothetical protein